jgi:hypothetical protein
MNFIVGSCWIYFSMAFWLWAAGSGPALLCSSFWRILRCRHAKINVTIYNYINIYMFVFMCLFTYLCNITYVTMDIYIYYIYTYYVLHVWILYICVIVCVNMSVCVTEYELTKGRLEILILSPFLLGMLDWGNLRISTEKLSRNGTDLVLNNCI